MTMAPGPLRRMLRARGRLVAVALLALVSLAAAGVSQTAAERLQETLDENWRGAYDILVTAGEGELAGLLPPNSVATASEGMTLEDVAAIRAVAGVDVAAPIGEVLIPMLSTPQAQFTLPQGHVGAGTTPQAFRVTVTYLTDDGLGERLISTESFELLVDETERELRPVEGCNINGVDVDPEEYPIIASTCGGPRVMPISYSSGRGTSGFDNEEAGTWLFTLGNLMSTTRVTLIDPVAEGALLGDAGAFLRPLEVLSIDGLAEPDALLAWADNDGGRHAADFLRMRAQEAGITGSTRAELEEWERFHREHDTGNTIEFTDPPYVPMLARETAPAPLMVRMDVESFGDAEANTNPVSLQAFQFPAHFKDQPGEHIGTTVVDASTLLNPFASDNVFVPWPGTSADGLVGPPWAAMLSIFITGNAQAPSLELISDEGDDVAVGLSADEFVSPHFDAYQLDGNAFTLTGDGSAPGVESVYASQVFATAGQMSARGAVVGGFTIESIEALQSGLAHVPLGAYEPVGSTLVPGSSDVATEAIEMRPSVSGLGLVSPETVAIASLESAKHWGQESPVNAVRVRVGDVGGFGADAIAAIADVASAIEELGFTATVVAGSSPTDVTVHVDGYAFGVTSPDEEQRVGPLGAVTQRWSELGAASRVDLAVTSSSASVLAVALGASALLLAAVQLASVPGRRAQASVMRTIGWPRRRIVRWMAAEELVSLLIVALAGAGAYAIANSRTTVGFAVGVALVAVIVTSALAVVLGVRPAASGIRPVSKVRGRRRMVQAQAWVTSPLRFAMRQLSVHRTNVIVQVLATLVVGVAAATVTVTVLQGRAAAGASALGVVAADQALWAQLGLGLIALIAGIVLAVIARRIDLGRRREQWATMRAMGWSTGQVGAVQVIEGVAVGIPAIAVTGALTWWFATETAPALLPQAVAAAIGATLLLSAVVVASSWRERGIATRPARASR